MVPTDARTDSYTGNVRRNHLGQIVVDDCASDGEHLRRPLRPDEGERQRCRHLVEQSFQSFVGKRGTLIVRIEFFEDEEGGEAWGEPPNAPL